MQQQPPTAAIIGTGVAGLASAIRLAHQGYQVTAFEASEKPGGKLTELRLGDFRFDAGPSLFTLPGLVEELFALCGKNSRQYFQYAQLPLVTRYFYENGPVVNAWADSQAFKQELAEKLGEDPAQIDKCFRKGKELYELTEPVFLRKSLHRLGSYLNLTTLKALTKAYKLDAFRTMAQANKQWFRNPLTQQMFNRFATYNGSDPYQAPATLNIIPHLEHELGAYFPNGGMYAITKALYQLALDMGVSFQFGCPVSQILVQGQTATGVQVGGEAKHFQLVVSNADVVNTYRRLLPGQPAPERTLSQEKSSSALIFYWAMDTSFPALDLHNIFFSRDYPGEFKAIFKEKTLMDDPTVYVYISSKKVPQDAPEGHENWFTMINVPGNIGQDWDQLIPVARQHILAKLSRMLGKEVAGHISAEAILDPRSIEERTSSSQGALYGNSSNNKFAAFLRHPNFSSRLKGLYFCGGSVHPGGGIPLCLLSAQIVGDLVSQANR